MAQADEKRKALYDAIKGDYDVGTYEEYNKKMDDPNKRKALYDAIKGDYDVGDWASFDSKLAGTTQAQQPANAVDDAVQANQANLPEQQPQQPQQETNPFRSWLSEQLQEVQNANPLDWLHKAAELQTEQEKQQAAGQQQPQQTAAQQTSGPAFGSEEWKAQQEAKINQGIANFDAQSQAQLASFKQTQENKQRASKAIGGVAEVGQRLNPETGEVEKLYTDDMTGAVYGNKATAQMAQQTEQNRQQRLDYANGQLANLNEQLATAQAQLDMFNENVAENPYASMGGHRGGLSLTRQRKELERNVKNINQAIEQTKAQITNLNNMIDPSIEGQIIRVQEAREATLRQIEALRKRDEERWREYQRENPTLFIGQSGRGRAYSRAPESEEIQALRQAVRNYDKAIVGLQNQQKRENGESDGFWDHFKQGVNSSAWERSQYGFWQNAGELLQGLNLDYGISDLNRVALMMHADEIPEHATEGEKKAYGELMQSQAVLQDVNNLYGQYTPALGRYGDIFSQMPGFMVPFITTAGWADALKIGDQAAIRGLNKLFGKAVSEKLIADATADATKAAVEKGLTKEATDALVAQAVAKATRQGMEAGWAKEAAEKGIIASIKDPEIGAGKTAATWLMRGIGQATDDVAMAGIRINTVAAPSTVAQAIDYRLGDVVLNDDGTYSFEKGKSWGEALSLAEMDNLVEFYSEALGFRYGGLLSLNRGAQLAGNVGLKRLSNFLSRADGSTYHKFWGDLNNLLGKAGVNDITEEVAEEYAGQYWRSILGLETAYTTDEEGNPVNLALTGQFHGDIWGGMVCSIGLMSAMKHGWSAGRYYYLNHKLNKADMVASELLTRSYGSIYNPLTKEREQRFAGVGWGAIKYAIDNTSNANMGLAAEAVIVDPTLTNAQKEAIMNYMTYLIEMRGYNLAGVRGELPPEQTEGMTADQTAVAKMLQGQATANYISGYESDGTPQDAVDARVRRDMKRDALVSLLGEDVVDQIDQDPMAMLRAMASDKLRYGDNEMDAVIDYINAKMAVDGMIRRESDDMDDQVAQSDAMIDQRTNFDTGKVQEATMKDNRKVYVVRGNVVRNEDGTINTQASDDTLVVRDDKTGQLEMVAPSALLSVDSEQDPTQLKEAAANTIRQQAMEQAQAKLNNQLPIQQGDTFDYVDENGNPTRVMVVPNADGVIDNGDGTINVTVDGQNVFPISIQFLRQQAEQLARQHSQDYDEAQRQQKEQEQQENEEQPQAQAAGEVVEEQPAPQEEASQEDNTIENNEESQASAELREATQQPKSALEQIPVDEQGNPIYEQSTPQLAWDALVEQTDGDENEAKEVVDTMVENKKAALKEAQKAQKKKATGTTIAEIIDERNERKAAVAQAQLELDFWQQVAGEQERLAKAQAEQQVQRDISAVRAAQERPSTHESPQTAREHGYRTVNGQRVDRQGEIPAVKGKDISLRFATRLSGDVMQNGKVALIEADQLQPSHLDGKENPSHFLNEAQPKDRKDNVSRASATKMAQEIRPQEITITLEAHKGAPVVNTRGEVIQGNNRSAALKQMWEDFPEKAAEYKEYLKEHAAEFGLTAEQIDQMENPVLVSMVDVDDNKAIELGQYTAADNESGGNERIQAVNTANLMTNKGAMQSFADQLLRSDDENEPLSDILRRTAPEVLRWMRDNKFISDNQYNSALENGVATSAAKDTLLAILTQRAIGGDKVLQKLFEELPARAGKVILTIANRIDTTNINEAGLLEEIRDSIRAFHDMSQDKTFSEAKDYDAARNAVGAYQSQTAIDEAGNIFGQGEFYSNLALELAALYKSNKQATIQSQISKVLNLMRGIQDDMFGDLDTTPRTLAQAVKEALNIDYNGQFGSGILGSNATTDTRGRQGSPEQAESGERNQGEEGPEVDRGGVEGNSEQGGGVNQEENPTNNGEVSTNQEENPNPENNETRNSAEETPNNGEVSTNQQQQPLTQGQQRYNNFVEKVRDLVKKLGNVPVRMATSSQELLAIARQMDNDAIANGKRGGLEAQIRQLFARGRTTRGFVNNGQVVIFAEGIYDLAEGSEEDALQTAREVLAHEVIAHVGLRQLMDAKDKEGHRKRRSSFKKFCDDVFKGMSAENRSRFLAYHWNTNMTANARLAMLNTALADDAWWQSLAQAQKEAFATQAQWDNLTLEQKAAILAGEQSATALRQGAADEYVASLAEKVERGEELTEPEQSVWQKIIDAIKRFFGAATVEGLTPQQIAQYLQESREFLQNEAQNGGEAQLLGEEEMRNNEENPQFSVQDMSEAQLDRAYFDAMEAGDEARMREVLNEVAQRRGYDTNEDWRWYHSAPVGGMEATDDEGNTVLYSWTLADEANNNPNRANHISDSYYSSADINGSRDESMRAIVPAISAIRRGEDPMVTIYRAVPRNVKEGNVRNGDWVTMSRAYADAHGRMNISGPYRIIEEQVPASQLYWDGNDINEWGFDDGKEYRYRNTKNNRKLDDLVTRDDNGNVIPPSRRFNNRNEDVRFSANEKDQNGLPMVLSSDGTTTFGDIPAESGLQAAPIKLSEGMITDPRTKAGYGLVHIEARHGNEIKAAGYNSIVDFVEYVARNWEDIKEGNKWGGNQTYLLEVPTEHNDTLIVELSKDGSYWSISTAGVFRKSYSQHKKEVYNRHATAKQPTETVGTSQIAEQSGTQAKTSMNAPTTSESKGSENSGNARENAENLQGEGEFNTPQGEARFSAQEQENGENIPYSEEDKGEIPIRYSIGERAYIGTNRATGEKRYIDFTRDDAQRVTDEVDNALKNRYPDVRLDKGGAQTGSNYRTLRFPNGSELRIRLSDHTKADTEEGLDNNMRNGIWWYDSNEANPRMEAYIDISRNNMNADDIVAFADRMAEYDRDGFPEDMTRVIDETKKSSSHPWTDVNNPQIDKAFGMVIAPIERRNSVAEGQEVPQNEDLFARAERIARDYEQQYENERRFSSVVYPRVLARDAYERRMRSSMFQTVEAMQDSMRSLFEATKAILGKRRLHIENLPEYQNAYIGENALSSVNQAEAEMVARQLFAPLLQEIARLAPSETENRTLIDYMMAKHGLERNRYMAERDAQRAFDNYQKKNPNGGRTLADFINEARQRDYAGLTALTGQDNVYDAEAVAEQMVADYESKHNTTVLWQRTRAVTDAILQKQYDSGLMTRASFDHIMGMYQNYIPLRGFDETTSDEVYAYLMSRGSGMASVDKVAKGRESKADDPIANLQAMMENAIMRGNRNVLVKQRFMNFAMNHPSDLISISDLWLELNDKGEWIPQFPDIKDGDTPAQITQKCEQFEQDMQAKAAADPDRYVKQSDRPDIPYKVVTKEELKEHQVIVSRGGRDYVLTVNGNPRLAQAINGKTNPDNDNFLGERVQRVLGSINRALSAFYTTRNPDFIISNFFRDMIYSNTMTHVKEKGNYARHYNVNYARTNPAMMNILLTRFRHGTLNMGNEMDRLFYEFMSNGGETGYASVRDIDAHKNEIQRELKKYAGRMPVGKALDYLGARFDELNRSVELCARFAAFVTSRQMGRTIGRAVYDAKEVSVNFNKKGAGGTFYKATGQTRIGNWAAAISAAGRLSYVFWNAGMQGMTNFGRQFGRHPAKAIAAAATMYTLGALVSHLGNMGGGDGDDDDNNAYWNLPDYLRRTNILFRTGDYWISIPLPIEFRAFYGMGELMTSLMYGREYKDGWGVASEVASQLTQVLPLDFLEGAGGFKNFIPSSLKPLAEAALFNVSWSGTPLQRETPWNQDRPQYTKAWKSANQYIVGMTEWLNRISGGNDKQQGKIDVSPAKIEYILSGYFGGVFNTINELTKMGETAIGKRDFDPRNFMLLTRILRTGDTGTKNRGVENEYWRIRNNADELKRKVREYEDALNSPNENTREHAEKEGYQKALDKILNSMEWKEVQVFEDYRKELNAANRAVKNTTDDEERAENDMEFTKLKREMLEAVRQMRQNKKKAEENEEEE